MNVARQPKSPDVISRVAPLGLRFQDVVSGRRVGDGLLVRAHPPGRPSIRRTAVVSRTGTYVFHTLPGLHEVETGAGDGAFWQASSVSGTFVVEVRDEQGRYQPFSFTATAPWQGVFAPDCLPPGGPAAPVASVPPPANREIPLFPAPARPADGMRAAVRAELWDPVRKVPAAWAVLHVTDPDGFTICGFADADGRVVVFLPYPSIFAPGFSSLSGFAATASGLPLASRSFLLGLRVFYGALDAALEYPGLCDLFAQPEAKAWADEGRTTPLTEGLLELGKDVVLRSHSGGSPLPTLNITTMGSTP